jgi:Innexin
MLIYYLLTGIPKIAICNYSDYSAGKALSGQCIINANVANEFVFVLLTIWIVLTTAWTTARLLFNLVVYLWRGLTMYLESEGCSNLSDFRSQEALDILESSRAQVSAQKYYEHQLIRIRYPMDVQWIYRYPVNIAHSDGQISD